MKSEKEGGSDSSSVNSKLSNTVSICCTCNRQSCKKFWCSFNNYWQLALALFAVMFYLVIGGAIFHAVEGPNEQRQIQQVQEDREIAMASMTEMLRNLTNLTADEVQNTTTTFINLGRIASTTIPAEQSLKWDFSSAFFFASTVITTIGEQPMIIQHQYNLNIFLNM